MYHRKHGSQPPMYGKQEAKGRKHVHGKQRTPTVFSWKDDKMKWGSEAVRSTKVLHDIHK